MNKIYNTLVKHYRILLCKISPKLASVRIYNKSHKKKIDLKNPKLFNEKLVYLKLKNVNNKLIIDCSDKVKVREYVAKMDYKNILNDVIGIYDNTAEIDWKSLPDRFVLKCNHGCGFNIICNNKKNFDILKAEKQLNLWLKEKYGYETAEPHYTKIAPKIICEKFLDMGNGKLPTDYKVYCFNGKAKIILVMNDRGSDIKKEFFDINWNLIHLRENEHNPKKITEKPNNLNYMLECAEKLSSPFEFVRVDFYDIDNKLIFGELTFTPAGCNANYTEEADKMLGNMLDLTKR